MKTMTCKQLGGACDIEFSAETFDEIAELSRNHGTEMADANDTDHMEAMNEMLVIMQQPDGLEKWMSQKRAEFEALEES